MDSAPKLCPSATCQPGNLLLGVQTAEGGLARILPPPQIDEAFVRAARQAGAPERRMRFVGACAESGCHQWQAGGCSIARRAIAALTDPPAAALPPCHIRGACRWFAQEGRAACAACAFISTDPAGRGAPH